MRKPASPGPWTPKESAPAGGDSSSNPATWSSSANSSSPTADGRASRWSPRTGSTKRPPNRSTVDGLSDGYGYQWWTGTADGSVAFQAIGYGGQLIEVVPDRHLVVVTTTEVHLDDATTPRHRPRPAVDHPRRRHRLPSSPPSELPAAHAATRLATAIKSWVVGLGASASIRRFRRRPTMPLTRSARPCRRSRTIKPMSERVCSPATSGSGERLRLQGLELGLRDGAGVEQ